MQQINTKNSGNLHAKRQLASNVLNFVRISWDKLEQYRARNHSYISWQVE